MTPCEADLDGIRLAYEAYGAGAPLLLLHEEGSDRREWDALIHHLPGGWRTIALDLRGHGESTPFGGPENPWDTLSIETFADDLGRFVATIVPHERVALLGAGLGGWAAQRFAAEHPDRVSHLALVGSPSSPGEVLRAHYRARLSAAASEPEVVRRTLAYLAAIPEYALPEEALAQFKGPALVVEPSMDPLYSPVQTLLWRRHLPQARLERPDEGRDFHTTEAGARWLATRLADLLSEAPQRQRLP